MTPNAQATGERKLDFIKIRDLCHKVNHQKSEKKTHRMRGNVCKPNI